MVFDEALAYLLSLGHETLTIKLGLENTRTLLRALGNPHQAFRAVQIAGTNGKGSTAVALASICRSAGIRVGLFTSPHLISITERIQIDGVPISEADFARFTEEVSKTSALLVEQRALQTLPTFFEQVTAIALVALRAAKVDLAILETGLGGRLDSTTAAEAKIVGITPIAMDHQEYLGHTLSEIAAEKAAIIRPGVIAIVAPQQDEALAVIMRECEKVGVHPRFSEPDRYRDLAIGLRGRHQITNAATAIALAEALNEIGYTIPREAIIRGVETAKHPGRLELCEGQPQILFDGAHNPAAAQALREYLDEFVKQPVTMIFGAMRDKALAEMIATLFPVVARIILTELENPRAASIETLLAAVPDGIDRGRILRSSSPPEALQMAREVTPADGLICVTGSLYLVGAVQAVLNEGQLGVAQESA